MNSTTKGILTVGAIAILVFFAYKKFLKPDNRKVLKNYLYATYGYSKDRENFVNSADKGYVDAWVDAIMNGKDTFIYENKTYQSNTGTIKK